MLKSGGGGTSSPPPPGAGDGFTPPPSPSLLLPPPPSPPKKGEKGAGEEGEGMEGEGGDLETCFNRSERVSTGLNVFRQVQTGGFLAGGEVWFGLFIKRLVVS